MKKMISVLLAIAVVLCVAAFAACSSEEPAAEETAEAVTAETETAPDLTEAVTAAPVTEDIGQGELKFTFTATFADGSQHIYNVSTNETTVGAALQTLGLIEGTEGDYGLYVDSVAGVAADYDADGTYWSFSINGVDAMQGVSETEIEAGASYELKLVTL